MGPDSRPCCLIKPESFQGSQLSIWPAWGMRKELGLQVEPVMGAVLEKSGEQKAAGDKEFDWMWSTWQAW